ncbi:MAG: cysteine synthase A [Candidatus Frackibacter sp. T328-2]|nr:MAG: cysteine synthase A [Candidatus Frackibacter sp. T328-2]
MKVIENVTKLIGKTPLVELKKMSPANGAQVFAKLEFFNPGRSVKDRIALSMIEDAEKKGRLKSGGTIVEPTSGNTGVGLALVGAAKGYKVVLTMPESMSMERRRLLSAYGADLVLTPAEAGMQGAINKAEELEAEYDNCFMPRQFENPANPEVHRKTTAQEILEAVDSDLDAFVAGVGTGGTLTGVGQVLKNEVDGVQVYAVEPEDSAVLSEERPGPHKIQGIGAGFIPEVLNTNIYDGVIKIDDDEAFQTSLKLAYDEALSVGISAGANVLAAIKVAEELEPDQKVVTILPDTGERYFSVHKYFRLGKKGE